MNQIFLKEEQTSDNATISGILSQNVKMYFSINRINYIFTKYREQLVCSKPQPAIIKC